MKYFFHFFLIFCLNRALCDNENWPLGAKQAGMGFTGVTFIDSWNSSHNQAALAFHNFPSMGLFSEQRFLIKEMSLHAFTFVIPTKGSGTFAIDGTYFGYTKYNETNIGLAYGIALSNNFSIGAKISYHNTHFEEVYGNTGNVVADLSLFTRQFERLYLGTHIYNLTRSKLAIYNDERIPTIIYFGIGYKMTERLFSTIELEKNVELKPIYKFGFDYNLFKNLNIRIGANTSPNFITFGLGYKINKIRADISFSYHQILGFSPHVGFIYNFKTEYTSTIESSSLSK
ncbi:MAG: hypothetical protein N3A01_03320 [Bacteroidales bacterium]|nr:hypothetical protein [Bacteroidales bacterium]